MHTNTSHWHQASVKPSRLKVSVIIMNQPQHIVASLPASPQSSTMILYLHSDSVHDGDDESQLVEARRSSWALNSRLNRMRKRHFLPVCKSLSAEAHREKRSRSSRKPVEQTKAQFLDGQSRWESSISIPKDNRESSTPTASTPDKRGNGRPTLPKRQKSIENSSIDEEGTSSKRVTKSNDAADALRSFRRSFHPEARSGVSSTTRKFNSAA
jgi:hypothetical protein